MPSVTVRRSTTVVVVAGCLIAVVTYGMRASLGLFTQPLSDLRGWDRETFAFAIAIQNLLWGIGQPFAGAIADRYGSGRVLAGGGPALRGRRRADGVQHERRRADAERRRAARPRPLRRVVPGGHRRLLPARAARPALGGDRAGDRRRLARPVPVRAARPGVPVGVRGGDRAR